MANGMKVKLIKKTVETKITKKGDKVSSEKFVMICEDRFGNQLTLKCVEPISGYAPGQVVSLTIKEDQKLLE